MTDHTPARWRHHSWRAFGVMEHVSTALGQPAAKVETLVDTILRLPLSLPVQFQLLRASLQVSGPGQATTATS